MILLSVMGVGNEVLVVYVVAPDLLTFSNSLKLILAGTES
jgi:hypothetical protein